MAMFKYTPPVHICSSTDPFCAPQDLGELWAPSTNSNGTPFELKWEPIGTPEGGTFLEFATKLRIVCHHSYKKAGNIENKVLAKWLAWPSKKRRMLLE